MPLCRVTKWYDLYKDSQSILFTSAVHGSFAFALVQKVTAYTCNFILEALGLFTWVSWKIFCLEIENSKNTKKWPSWEAHSLFALPDVFVLLSFHCCYNSGKQFLIFWMRKPRLSEIDLSCKWNWNVNWGLINRGLCSFGFHSLKVAK